MSKVVFRNEAKIALVSPLDAETPAKDYALNIGRLAYYLFFLKYLVRLLKLI